MSHTLAYGVGSGLDIVNAPIAHAVHVISHFGGIAVSAHPYRWGVGNSLMTVPNIKIIEGINGHNSPKENRRAIDLAKMGGYFTIAGSDSHDPDSVGRVYTEFFDRVTETNLVACIKSGRYRVRVSPEYTKLWEGTDE